MELLASFSATHPTAFSYWPYYDGFRYIDGDELCLLELASEPTPEFPNIATLPQRITKTRLCLGDADPLAIPVAVLPRLGGGALVVTKTGAYLTKKENFADAVAWHKWLTFNDFTAVAAACDIDGSAYVADNHGRIYLLEPTAIKTKCVVENLGEIISLTWSAFGDQVLVVTTENLQLFDYDAISGFANRRMISTGLVLNTPEVILTIWPSINGFYLLTAHEIIEISIAGELLENYRLTTPDSCQTCAAAITGDGDFTYIVTVDDEGSASLWALNLTTETVPIRFFAG